MDPRQKSHLEGRSEVTLPLLLVRVESFQPQDTGRDPCRKRGHNLCTLREGRSLGPVTVLYQEKAESASARGGRARNCHSAPSIGTGQVSLWRRGEEMMKKKNKTKLNLHL